MINKVQKKRERAIARYFLTYIYAIMCLSVASGIIIIGISTLDDNLHIEFYRGLEIAMALVFNMLSMSITILIPLITIDTVSFMAFPKRWEKTLSQLYKKKFNWKAIINVIIIHLFMLIGQIRIWVSSIYINEDAYVPDIYIKILIGLVATLTLASVFIIIFQKIRPYTEQYDNKRRYRRNRFRRTRLKRTY